MAKRKRLSPARMNDPAPTTPLAGPPIAQVAGEASALAALREVSETLAEARAEGRLVQKLPLEAVEMGYLTRDRLAIDEEELAALIASLRARGQQTPIEVVALEEGRFGLISGWRRMTALGRLAAEDPRFGVVQAIVRTPSGAGEAYVAMVEENEIRVGLSYFERARIVTETVAAGVYPSEKKALQSLFASASRAKRSKIGAFIPVVRQLGPVLRFPAALPERVGLQLSKLLSDAPAAEALVAHLHDAAPATEEAERALLTEALRPAPSREEPVIEAAPLPAEPTAWDVTSAFHLERREDGLHLSGSGVDAHFEARLRQWLRSL